MLTGFIFAILERYVGGVQGFRHGTDVVYPKDTTMNSLCMLYVALLHPSKASNQLFVLMH